MSLVSYAIRTCLAEAFRNATLAEGRVFDSQVIPIDAKPEEGAKAKIIVSTDDDETKFDGQFDLQTEKRKLDVVIEMELSSKTVVATDGADPQISYTIPYTDAGLEATLDFLQRQVLRCLADPKNAWSNLGRKFISSPSQMLKRRGAGVDKGVRFAARQIIITCTPAYEPEYGAAPSNGSLWGSFIAAMRANEDLEPYADVVSALIIGEPLPAWQVLQASLGLTDAAIQQLGPASYDVTETGEPPELTEVDLDEIDADDNVLRTVSVVDGEASTFEPVQ